MPLQNVTVWLVALGVNVLWCGVVVVLHLVVAVAIGWIHLTTTLRSLSTQLLSGLHTLVKHPFWALRSVFSLHWYQTGFQGIQGSKGAGKMTLKATKFTPQVLISGPRRSPAIPSPNGKKALFTVGRNNGLMVSCAN